MIAGAADVLSQDGFLAGKANTFVGSIVRVGGGEGRGGGLIAACGELHRLRLIIKCAIRDSNLLICNDQNYNSHLRVLLLRRFFQTKSVGEGMKVKLSLFHFRRFRSRFRSSSSGGMFITL